MFYLLIEGQLAAGIMEMMANNECLLSDARLNGISIMEHKITGCIQPVTSITRGVWGFIKMCSVGSYASGFLLKVQDNQGAADDTALNGIELECRYVHLCWAFYQFSVIFLVTRELGMI